MTVGELIEQLSDFNPDMDVVFSEASREGYVSRMIDIEKVAVMVPCVPGPRHVSIIGDQRISD